MENFRLHNLYPRIDEKLSTKKEVLHLFIFGVKKSKFDIHSSTSIIFNYLSFNDSFNHQFIYINDLFKKPVLNKSKQQVNAKVNECLSIKNDRSFCDKTYSFLKKHNVLYIPKGLKRILQREIPSKLLKTVSPNKKTAIELCLIFCSFIYSKNILNNQNDDSKNQWKHLNANFLQNTFSRSPYLYKHIKMVLIYPCKINGAIIKCNNTFKKGFSSIGYLINEQFMEKGCITYELKENEPIVVYKNYTKKKMINALNNPICNNLITLYKNIQLPTRKEIITHAKSLIKKGYKTKKGKLLTFKEKCSKVDKEIFSYVEDGLNTFDYLTRDGLLIPQAGSDKNGGRVVDSFTLMPSWIRNLVKINCHKIEECDYSCLHPNIAVKTYSGELKHITHEKIQKELNLDLSKVKTEHLSFFNKNIWQMKTSPLFDYYRKLAPKMLQRIINDKKISKYKYKSTYRKLFKKEVEIMTDVIVSLNKMNIYVGYIYDALFFEPKHFNIVKSTMDEVIMGHGIFTSSK